MTEHKCSFCGVKEDEVKVLVGDESGGAYICEACWEKIGMLLNFSVRAAIESALRKDKNTIAVGGI